MIFDPQSSHLGPCSPPQTRGTMTDCLWLCSCGHVHEATQRSGWRRTEDGDLDHICRLPQRFDPVVDVSKFVCGCGAVFTWCQFVEWRKVTNFKMRLAILLGQFERVAT